MPTLVAFFRGINVGRNKRIAMADLRATLEELGYGDVRTHLQSGNAIFTTDDSKAEVEKAIRAAVNERCGVDSQVIARTAKELAAVVKADPFGDVATEPKKYAVAFCEAKPKAEAVEELEAGDHGNDLVKVIGTEIYAWMPGGFSDNRVMAGIDARRLGVQVTVRNWNTVSKVAEMATASS